MSDDNKPPIYIDYYELRVYNGNTWNICGSYALDYYEEGLTLNILHLKQGVNENNEVNEMEVEKEDENKTEKEEKVYIGLGTGYVFMRGEDRLGRGRISFFINIYIIYLFL